MVQGRPLPGIVFRAEPPPVVAFPRMDVAAFVGFAQRGPVNMPVVVEDYPQFEDIFGGVFRLAWDEEASIWQTACLAPAVRQFFEQGGRRCWVVRVANLPDGADDPDLMKKAAANHYPVVGLLKSRTVGSYTTVQAQARSVGSWSDGVQVASSILLDTVASTTTTITLTDATTALSVAHLRGNPLRAGDVMQLDFTDGLHRAYLPLYAADMTGDATALSLETSSDNLHWFQRVDATTPLNGTAATVMSASAATTSATLSATDDALTLQLDAELSVEPDDWLTFDTGVNIAWLLVDQVQGTSLAIRAAWFEGADDAVTELTIARIQRVQMTLQVRERSGAYRTLMNLGLSAPHPRFAGYLPDDATLFDLRFGQPQFMHDDPAVIAAGLYDEVKNPRFPVMLSLQTDEGDPLTTAQNETVLLPLGLDALPHYRAATPLDADPLVRDGLVPVVDQLEIITSAAWAQFWQDIYLDPILKLSGQRALRLDANDRLYIQNLPLLGLHVLFPMEEVSIIALPDIAHRGWVLTTRQQAAVEDDSDTEADTAPEYDSTDPFIVCVPPIEEETTPELDPPATEVLPAWNMLRAIEFDASGLLAIQQQAARLAAARGDCIIVQSMPKHFRRGAALQHQRDLHALLRFEGETTDSFVALYHPWLISRDPDGDLLHTAPDGAVCGMMAKRTLERGAWVAPANQSLRNTLELIPRLTQDDEQSLYVAGINPIQSQARGFVVWGAHTQSLDMDLMNINVRRLLILLRRIALQEGESYVFAPHDARFRKRIKQDFERRLALLFAHGAFSGRSPSEAYRVVIDETLNTRNSVENGRLIVELRVAPSRPVTFITVRLLQTDNGLVTIEEVLTNG